MIISSGIGSGLDIAGIVQQLVAAEAAPVETRLATQEARAQSKLSAFGSLQSALSDLKDKLDTMKSADNFLARKASSGNEDLFTVTVDKLASPARYSVEVVQLAQSQKLTSGAFADANTIIGTGTLTVGIGAASFDIEISEENNSLAGIRDAINSAPGNAGVAATIVNAEAGSYLILSGENTGSTSTITVNQTGGDGGLSALEYDPGAGLAALTEAIIAQDALVRIDGFDISSSTNTVSGAVDGVTLNLLQSSPGSAESLLVENDVEVVRQSIGDFVESYNNLIETFDQLTDYNAEADVAAPLLGDATVRSIREQIRREFSTAVADIDAPFDTLAEIGVEVQLDGKLSIVDDDLSAVLAEDFFQLGQLFSTSDGYAVRLFDLVQGFLDSDGIVETRTSGLAEKIDGFTDERDSLNERLATLETRLLRQFNALDSLISQLTSTSTFLTQQLSSLPGATKPDSN